MQSATTKFEIIGIPMVLERVEVNSIKSAHCKQKQNLKMTPYLLNKFQRSEYEDLRNLTETEITEGKDMTTFLTLQRRRGHNATHYHNLNTLPCALLYSIVYSEICLVLGCLQQATTCYCHHFFNIYIYIYIYIYKYIHIYIYINI